MLFAFLVSLPACVALASWPSFSLVVLRRDLECYQVDRGDNTTYTQERECMLGDNAARCRSSSATTHSDGGEERGPEVLRFVNMTMA